MGNTFILEYSKSQKVWHHNHGQNIPNTNGYVTISENCTDDLAWEFEIFLVSKYGEKYDKKLSVDDVKIEWALFTNSPKELY